MIWILTVDIFDIHTYMIWFLTVDILEGSLFVFLLKDSISHMYKDTSKSSWEIELKVVYSGTKRI